jgi:hypothetical protein
MTALTVSCADRVDAVSITPPLRFDDRLPPATHTSINKGSPPGVRGSVLSTRAEIEFERRAIAPVSAMGGLEREAR